MKKVHDCPPLCGQENHGFTNSGATPTLNGPEVNQRKKQRLTKVFDDQTNHPERFQNEIPGASRHGSLMQRSTQTSSCNTKKSNKPFTSGTTKRQGSSSLFRSLSFIRLEKIDV